MNKFNMFITAVCVLFLIKPVKFARVLRHDSVSLTKRERHQTWHSRKSNLVRVLNFSACNRRTGHSVLFQSFSEE